MFEQKTVEAQEMGPILAETPVERSALRSQFYILAADEIAKIDTVDLREINKGRIGVPLDAISATLGRSERDFARSDPQKLALLTEAFEDVFKVKITCPAHLFNEVKKRICEERDIYGKKLEERKLIARYLRRIGEKLVNGHAGTWI